MFCSGCGKTIADDSCYCNYCGVDQRKNKKIEPFFVNSIHNTDWHELRIAIETNDPNVIEKCKQIHAEIKYQFRIIDDCDQITKVPGLLYFITEGFRDLKFVKGLAVHLESAKQSREMFGELLSRYLLLSGYAKQPDVPFYSKDK